MIEAAADVLSDPALIAGIVGGFLVLAGGITVWSIRGRRVQRFGGLAVAAMTMVLLLFDASDDLGASQFIGVALLALAGRLHRSAVVGALLAVPGAFLVMRPATFEGPAWMAWVAFAAVVLAAPSVASFDLRYWRTGLGLPLFGLATLGVFLTVPDTEGGIVLFGVAGVAGFLGWPKPFASLGASGAYAAVGVYVWVAAAGATGRPASIIASVAVLGLLVVVPIAIRLRSTGWAHRLGSIDPLLPLIAQLLLVLLISRTAGRMLGIEAAAALTSAFLIVAAALMLRRPSQLPD